MAVRGAKPKPAHLRLVEGTHRTTRHGSESAARDAIEKAASTFGKLTKSRSLKGDAAAAWKRYIDPASWLDASREPAAIAFCELWAEFIFCPRGFAAAKHGQLRHYMAELGLTDERNRGEHGDNGDGDDTFDA